MPPSNLRGYCMHVAHTHICAGKCSQPGGGVSALSLWCGGIRHPGELRELLVGLRSKAMKKIKEMPRDTEGREGAAWLVNSSVIPGPDTVLAPPQGVNTNNQGCNPFPTSRCHALSEQT